MPENCINIHLDTTETNITSETFHMANEIITLPYDSDGTNFHYYELVSGVYQTEEGYCTLYFKHENDYYKVDNTDVRGTKKDELGLCTLLFYKWKLENVDSENERFDFD